MQELFRTPTIKEIQQRFKKQWVIVVLNVFGDESHDEKEQRVFAVAGILGSQEEWENLTPLWLERTKGKAFHAADCESDHGEYKLMPHEENQKLYRDLVRMLTQTKMLGFGACIDLQGHTEILQPEIENLPYQKCFGEVISYFATKTWVMIPPQKVAFKFDLNSRSNASSAVLYDYLKHTLDWKFGSCLDEIAFVSRNDHIGIQAADILARETMKFCDNFFVGSRKYRVRESMNQFRLTRRYEFRYFPRKYFADLKRQFPDIELKTGLKGTDYFEWLQQKKLDDNLMNRNKFLLKSIE